MEIWIKFIGEILIQMSDVASLLQTNNTRVYGF